MPRHPWQARVRQHGVLRPLLCRQYPSPLLRLARTVLRSPRRRGAQARQTPPVRASRSCWSETICCRVEEASGADAGASSACSEFQKLLSRWRHRSLHGMLFSLRRQRALTTPQTPRVFWVAGEGGQSVAVGLVRPWETAAVGPTMAFVLHVPQPRPCHRRTVAEHKFCLCVFVATGSWAEWMDRLG
jgi:hypothetical protein